jgi:uncharacterized protein (DUF169 family)
MAEDFKAIANQLSRQLELDRPPIQVSYLESPPAGIPEHPGGVPSVCTFFALGADRPFYAGLAKHEDCEIGAYVLGIPPKGDLGTRLMSTIGSMQKEGYLNPGEEANVPHNEKAPSFVAYGPLGSLPVAPTGILLFVNPRSAMLAVEAAGSVPDAAPVPFNGRPMCAILPILNGGAPVAASLGCTGSRIYTDLPTSSMIVGVRGDRLAQFAKKLDRIVQANLAVATENESRKRKAPNAHRRRPA